MKCDERQIPNWQDSDPASCFAPELPAGVEPIGVQEGEDKGEAHDDAFHAALKTRYERLSLLTLDLAEAAGDAVRDFARVDLGKSRGRFDHGIASMTKAVWAHTVIERLRNGETPKMSMPFAEDMPPTSAPPTPAPGRSVSNTVEVSRAPATRSIVTCGTHEKRDLVCPPSDDETCALDTASTPEPSPEGMLARETGGLVSPNVDEMMLPDGGEPAYAISFDDEAERHMDQHRNGRGKDP